MEQVDRRRAMGESYGIHPYPDCQSLSPQRSMQAIGGTQRLFEPGLGSKGERAEDPCGIHASVRDNFVYAISYFYNFVTSHLP
jgi:hypothetical protein